VQDVLGLARLVVGRGEQIQLFGWIQEFDESSNTYKLGKILWGVNVLRHSDSLQMGCDDGSLYEMRNTLAQGRSRTSLFSGRAAGGNSRTPRVLEQLIQN
jgi:hypothetical protein